MATYEEDCLAWTCRNGITLQNVLGTLPFVRYSAASESLTLTFEQQCAGQHSSLQWPDDFGWPVVGCSHRSHGGMEPHGPRSASGADWWAAHHRR